MEVNMRLQGKVAIVTGGSSGIGLATARKFVTEGASVIAIGRNGPKAEKAAKEIPATNGARALGMACDVSVEEDVIRVVDRALNEFKRFDIVVNNAGVMIFKSLEELTREDWRSVLEVDLLGAFYFTKQAFLKMREGGAIVNVASIHAVETTPLVSAYAAAKAALLSLTRSSALEGAARKIRVNAILPGAIDTPMLWENPNVKSGLEKIDRGMVGRAEDIADVAAFLASEEAAFVQGASIIVDGGRLGRL
jgi:meso-butanediol dehydrogenase/(S,S)-butanediol dehydrogenase/diacetyl reductase